MNPGTLILQPQKFENTEVGAKWNINPRLLFTAAVYELNRTNVPIADPSGNGLFFASGAHQIHGFETALTGYVTPDWQIRARLCLYRRAHHQRDVADDRARQPRSARAVQPVLAVEQIPDRSDLGGSARHDLFLGLLCLVRRHGESARLRALRCGVYAKINEIWRVQLNVENIFNTGYWATADGNNNISPGQPVPSV